METNTAKKKIYGIRWVASNSNVCQHVFTAISTAQKWPKKSADKLKCSQYLACQSASKQECLWFWPNTSFMFYVGCVMCVLLQADLALTSNLCDRITSGQLKVQVWMHQRCSEDAVEIRSLIQRWSGPHVSTFVLGHIHWTANTTDVHSHLPRFHSWTQCFIWYQNLH